MRLELKREAKKTAIVCYGTRISMDGPNVRTVDMIHIRKYFLEVLGRSQVDFVSMKTKKEEGLDYFKDIFEIGLNDYDEVVIYNCVPNVFGGIFKAESIETMKCLYNFTGDIWYFFCEEAAYPSDFSIFVDYKRYGEPFVKTTKGNVDMPDSFLRAWSDKVYKNMKVLFIGDDYEAYCKRYNAVPQKGKYADCGIKTIKDDADWAIFPLNEYYGAAEAIESKTDNYSFERPYDLVYYGNARAGRRNKIIKDLYDHSELNNLFVGYEPNFVNKPTVLPYISHEELFPKLCEAYATVILCSDSHNDLIRTVRFFEALSLDLIGFMWYEYDTQKAWIKNEELREFIYIHSYKELKEKLERVKQDEQFFRHIVELERQEVQNWYKYSLNLYK